MVNICLLILVDGSMLLSNIYIICFKISRYFFFHLQYAIRFIQLTLNNVEVRGADTRIVENLV